MKRTVKAWAQTCDDSSEIAMWRIYWTRQEARDDWFDGSSQEIVRVTITYDDGKHTKKNGAKK